SASADGTARLWDLARGRLVETIQSPADRVYAVAFAPDGKSLAVGYGGLHGLVQWWELAPLRRRESWAAHAGYTRGLAFSPDGRTLATCGNDSAVKLWDLESIAAQRLTPKNPSTAVAVAFSPDGQTVAAITSYWASTFVWSVGSRRLRDFF